MGIFSDESLLDILNNCIPPTFIMAITLMPIMNVGGMQLFKISSNDSSEKLLPKSKEISLRLIYVYLSLTTLCAVTYKIFGMNIFDSITHSMTTIATGGFSNYNE